MRDLEGPVPHRPDNKIGDYAPAPLVVRVVDSGEQVSGESVSEVLQRILGPEYNPPTAPAVTHDDHVRHFDYTTMRAAHADTVRISLQRRAIARAQESGAWARLPRSMRRRLAHLTVPGAVASADLILNGAVPVVINSGDYWPWTPRQHPVPAGTSESTPECLELVVDTETDYLWTLHATGFLFVERFELRPPGGS